VDIAPTGRKGAVTPADLNRINAAVREGAPFHQVVDTLPTGRNGAVTPADLNRINAAVRDGARFHQVVDTLPTGRNGAVTPADLNRINAAVREGAPFHHVVDTLPTGRNGAVTPADLNRINAAVREGAVVIRDTVPTTARSTHRLNSRDAAPVRSKRFSFKDSYDPRLAALGRTARRIIKDAIKEASRRGKRVNWTDVHHKLVAARDGAF
jgi:hypothetical protein